MVLFLPGTRYMVVDCGGGTVDITVHEMESKAGNLIELYKATGGPYGSVGKSPSALDDLDLNLTLFRVINLYEVI